MPITWRPTLPSSFKLGRLWEGLGYLLFPNTCYSCKQDLAWQEKGPLCLSCRQALELVGPLYCMRCGKPLPDGGAHCYDCRGSKAKKYTCKIIRSALVFNETLRPLIYAFKYADNPHLAVYLAQQMHQQWARYTQLHTAQVLIPVPLYAKKQKQRGYNQAELLARQLGLLQGIAVDTNSLQRQRNTPSQTKLGRQARFENMQDAFVCIAPQAVKGKVVLLMDDVATTGATLEACARALKAGGAKKVMAYTLAREV